jgi:hypothetical protein
MRRGVVKATLALGAIAAVGAGLALTGAGAARPSGPQATSRQNTNCTVSGGNACRAQWSSTGTL